MRRPVTVLAVASLLLGGCGGESEPFRAEESPAETSSPTATHAPGGDDVIEIEIKGGEVEPRGERVEVGVGEQVALAVESDRAAELHVHSSPEQVVEVPRGGSTVTLVIERPGIVDVEEHDTGVVVLQLEVR